MKKILFTSMLLFTMIGYGQIEKYSEWYKRYEHAIYLSQKHDYQAYEYTYQIESEFIQYNESEIKQLLSIFYFSIEDDKLIIRFLKYDEGYINQFEIIFQSLFLTPIHLIEEKVFYF